MAASANNNNNNNSNNSSNKRPTQQNNRPSNQNNRPANQNNRPQNSANKRPNNQNKAPQQQQHQSHVQHHNTNNHHDQGKQQTQQQAAAPMNNQQWQSQTATGGNWQTGQQASNGYDNYQANGYQAAGYQAPGLSCWKCNADSFDLCEKRGYEEKCQSNEQVCELEIRERMGYIYQIHMGCKSADACANNKKANFDQANPHYTQCRPEKNMGYHHSVCRQCCHDSLCTKSPSWWYPASREEWAYE